MELNHEGWSWHVTVRQLAFAADGTARTALRKEKWPVVRYDFLL